MSEGETKSMSAEVDDDGVLRLVTTTEPEQPIDEIPPKRRLGILIRRARVRAEKGLAEVAEVLGISQVTLGEVERGNIPMKLEHIQQIAILLRCDDRPLIDAARDFHTEVWKPTGGKEGVVSVEVTGDAREVRSPEHVMPPEQLFVEYREGWFAGAAGRDNPMDMSPEWERGHEDGRLAMEDAFNRRRVDLGTHHGDGKAGSSE